MRKIALIVLLLLSCNSILHSQTIKYYNNINTALDDAKIHAKPIFVYIDIQHPIPPKPGIVIIKSGLEDHQVAAYYNRTFINVKLNYSDSTFVSFKKIYPLETKEFPIYLFFDAEGGLVYKGLSLNNSLGQYYLDMAQQALKVQASDKNISKYETLRRQHKIDAATLKEYIALKEKFGLYNNADLVDEYVDKLTIGAFNNYNEVLFILNAGPLAYGKAYNLCFSNRKITDSIYKTEPLEIRKAINNHIIVNTRNEAIRTRNFNLAIQLSNFVRGTWSNDYARGNKAATEETIYYYNVVKDTANYYRQASYFYDNYYMGISADSARRLKVKALNELKQNSTTRIKTLNAEIKKSNTSINSAGSTKHKLALISSSSVGNPINDVADILNNAAYNFYKLDTHNLNYLSKALVWSKRSIELSPDTWAYYDTLAHILYRLSFYEEALVEQKKAIQLAKQNSMAKSMNQVNPLITELTKMQQHTL
ncbi:hypothetical protein HH214_17085 [Mucilaginibacter robiniae]|uniref:DUF255 domain-containing protein n=1 Tax=Mucilaginibacter robiniae TaxID=2728022 RepID=A0A7L5E2W0_9SPHI|nr:hypothetical protein [Mucilaginibacter robiniae]QJD97465.1 hypothetical protein HH214_17085 [Mucilaginibacter robiniae]